MLSADAYPGSIARLASAFGTWLQGGGTRVTLEAPVVFEVGDSVAQADDGASARALAATISPCDFCRCATMAR